MSLLAESGVKLLSDPHCQKMLHQKGLCWLTLSVREMGLLLLLKVTDGLLASVEKLPYEQLSSYDV